MRQTNFLIAIATRAARKIAATIAKEAKRSENDDEGETESRSHIDEAHKDECNEQRSAKKKLLFEAMAIVV